jgi:uncharacterized cupin superfamily protein
LILSRLAGAGRTVGRAGMLYRRHGEPAAHTAELVFSFVLPGRSSLIGEGFQEPLVEGDAFAVPSGNAHCLVDCSPDFELLEVRLPG